MHLVYNATTNRFLAGNKVVLTDRATQCLTSFSLDFERTSQNAKGGPDMSVQSVTVNGQPATFTFVQPTYPGDPKGQDDPNPAAHEASQSNPVGGPHHNPLPPACTPELTSVNRPVHSLDGAQCPANKLVITPSKPIKDGSPFTVTVNYTGRPGLHNDGDGSTEGWFRAPDGGFVTTEPVATEDWMPLNDYPSAKPTYDFSDTVTAGRTVLANGVLVSVKHHLASKEFPKGSVTWNWHSPAPVASYLVEDSVGNYILTERTADNGVRFYEAEDRGIKPARRAKNLKIMNLQQGITEFESQFNGSYPFTSDGVVVGTPNASFEEEMQTMITFAGGFIDTDVLYHENMHQWWGDNVTESSYNLTYFKEGLATLAEFLYQARLAERKAGGPYHAQGSGRVPGQPGPPVQLRLRPGQELLDGRPVESAGIRPVQRLIHLRSAGNRLHRPASDSRTRQLHPCPAADPADLRRGQRHRGSARGGLRPVAAGTDQCLQGQARRVLQAVVGHGLRLWRREEPALRSPVLAWRATTSTAPGGGC